MSFSRKTMQALAESFKNLGSFLRGESKRKAEQANEHKKLGDTTEDLEQGSSTCCTESCLHSEEFSSEMTTVAALESSTNPQKKKVERSMLSELRPGLKRHVASYLSTKDAFRLSKTNKTFHSELSLDIRELSPTFLLRKMFWNSRNDDCRFVQKLPTTDSNSEASRLRSVHVHCQLTPGWEIQEQDIPFVELLVLERDTARDSRATATKQFKTGRVIARGINCLWDNADWRMSLRVAVSFEPKQCATKDQSPYELWVRWSSGRGQRCVGPGYGEVIALGTSYKH